MYMKEQSWRGQVGFSIQFAMENQTKSYLWMFLATIALVFISNALWWFNKRTRCFHDLATCEELLQTSNLTKRAAPNERVKVAFGIENSFTTTDTQYHKKFLHSIRETLSHHNDHENRVYIAAEATRNTRYMLLLQKDISLEKLVKNVVFQAVISMFFPETRRLTTTEIEFCTNTIDSLWYDSKSPWKIFLAKYFPRCSSIVQKREILHLKLKEIFLLSTQGDIPPRSNPLNTILPAYIGLWKVVLKSLIEARFRSTPLERDEYASLLFRFIREPTDKIWYAKNVNKTSAQSIIAETLRLYPPTRRIHMLGEDGTTRAVDIETMHRKGDVWGADPDTFNPHRWASLDVVTTEEYMPFGSKHSSISRCPSRRRGGPKLCAILLGVLLHEINDEWELTDGDMVLGAKSLVSGRDSFKNLMLRRTPPKYSI